MNLQRLEMSGGLIVGEVSWLLLMDWLLLVMAGMFKSAVIYQF